MFHEQRDGAKRRQGEWATMPENGVMEWWSTGVLVCGDQRPRYSITPLLHYSITPLLHYSITPFPFASVFEDQRKPLGSRGRRRLWPTGSSRWLPSRRD